MEEESTQTKQDKQTLESIPIVNDQADSYHSSDDENQIASQLSTIASRVSRQPRNANNYRV